MRTPQEVIAELKNVTYWSQPNIKFAETMALLHELEAILNPTEETVEEPVVEETIVEEVVEEPTVEPEVTIEEKPAAKKPAAKKPAKK